MWKIKEEKLKKLVNYGFEYEVDIINDYSIYVYELINIWLDGTFQINGPLSEKAISIIFKMFEDGMFEKK